VVIFSLAAFVKLMFIFNLNINSVFQANIKLKESPSIVSICFSYYNRMYLFLLKPMYRLKEIPHPYDSKPATIIKKCAKHIRLTCLAYQKTTTFSKTVISLIIMTLSIPLHPLNAQTYKINKYGLQLIKDWSGYQTRIKMDSDLALMPLDSLIPDLKTDFVYATKNNFTHTILYQRPRAYLRKPAALALQKIAQQLRPLGYGLLIYDAYRPYNVTEKMWQVVPDNRYAADPKHGSGHNKGISVDLSLYSLQTGKAVPMPTEFDNFTSKAHQGYQNLPDSIIKNRALLKKFMEAGGFSPLSTEWWHFSYPNKTSRGHPYLLMDLNFDALSGQKQ